MNSTLLTAIAFALFLGAAVCYSAILFLDAPAAPAAIGSDNPSSRPARYSSPFVIAGLITLFAGIGLNCVTTRHSPFASEFGTLLVGAWAVGLIFFIWDRKTRIPAVGALAMLTNCILLSVAFAHSHAHISTDPLLRNPLVSIHVLSIVAAYALTLVCIGCAGLYLTQNRLLKLRSKNPIVRRLPPLTRLDAIAFQCVAYALPLLTLSLVVIPLIFTAGMKGPVRNWFEDTRFISTVLLWLLFSGYLSLRLLLGWRGVRLQVILLIGIVIAFAAYALPMTTAHQFN